MNERLAKYLEGYCRKEKCSVEEALTHNIVQGVAEEYEKQNAEKISKQKEETKRDKLEVEGMGY